MYSFLQFWKKNVREISRNQDAFDTQSSSQSTGIITIEAVRQSLKDIDDAHFSVIHTSDGDTVTLVFLKSLIDSSTLQRVVLNPLNLLMDEPPQEILKLAKEVRQDQLGTLLQNILAGFTVIFFEKRQLILEVNTFSPPQRSVSTSENETTVIGPQDSFTESLETNLSLIKRRIHSINLKTKIMLFGTETRNYVAVLYMENIANPENVQRVLHRIQNIEYDGLMGLAIIEQMLEDKPYSPFPQFALTARPDYTATQLLDGRIVVLFNGSPDAAICPATFLEMFMTQEDYYNRWSMATLLRFIRFFGFFVTIFLTSTYVSVLTFHPEMLPPAMLTLLSESRSKVPFPPLFEVLMMEFVIETLREAGARMPTKIGQTLGIVGGIVIGTAAVEAGLASNILIVVVAISALLSFLPASFLMSNASRFMRYIFIVMAGVLGMYGQAIALAWMFAHLSNMTSLGSPYMSLFPRKFSDLANSVIRAPIAFLISRSGISRAKKEMKLPPNKE